MRQLGAIESGVTLTETLVVAAIVSAVVLYGVTVSSGSQAGARSQTMAQLLGLLNRAHNLAGSNGARIQIAPSTSGPGSDVTIYDAALGGNAVVTTTTPERIGAYCLGSAACGNAVVGQSFSLYARRDGSFVAGAGNTYVLDAKSLTLGIVDGGQVLDAYTIDPMDLHATPATVP